MADKQETNSFMYFKHNAHCIMPVNYQHFSWDSENYLILSLLLIVQGKIYNDSDSIN